jgi:hypothetical protein
MSSVWAAGKVDHLEKSGPVLTASIRADLVAAAPLMTSGNADHFESGQSAPLISMKGSLLIRSMFVENVGGEKNWSVAKAKSEKKAPEERPLDRWINIDSE